VTLVIAPVSEPVVVSVKSLASTPVTGVLNVTRNTTEVAAMLARAGS